MARRRLSCFVSGERDPGHPDAFPDDDESHPLWVAIDALADGIHARLAGAKAPSSLAVDGLLTVSSDAPPGCCYFWVDLPLDQHLRRDLLALCLDHLSLARRASPNLGWTLALDEVPLVWAADRFRLPDDDGV